MILAGKKIADRKARLHGSSPSAARKIAKGRRGLLHLYQQPARPRRFEHPLEEPTAKMK
jgi:hypothetical protein